MIFFIFRAQSRLEKEREEHKASTGTQKQAKLQELHKKMRVKISTAFSKTGIMTSFLQTLSIESSQIGDSRPISFVEFSPNGKLMATASWLIQYNAEDFVCNVVFICRSGLCKLWSVPECEEVRTLRGHGVNVGAIVFHPQATISLDESACCMASCSQDGAVKLWNLTR